MGLVEMLRLPADGAGEAEVTDLDCAILVHETVGGLQIAVVDARRVDVVEADEQAVENVVDVHWQQCDVLLDQFL